MEKKARTTVAFVIFIVAYVLLTVGLLGKLVDYRYTLKIHKSWFNKPGDADLTPQENEEHSEEISRNPSLMQLNMTLRHQWRAQKKRAKLSEAPLMWKLGKEGLVRTVAEEVQPGLVPWLLEEAREGRTTYLPAFALIFFGVGLPLLKLVLVLFALLAPMEKSTADLTLTVAKHLSRWAAVDAISEALMVALCMKGGMHAKHLEGYAAFVGYVVLSTIAVSMLEEPHSGQKLPSSLPITTTLPVYCFKLSLAVCLILTLVGCVCSPLGKLYVAEDALFAKTNLIVKEKAGPLGAFLLGTDVLEKIAKRFAEVVPKPQADATVFQAGAQLLFSGHFYTVVGSMVLLAMVFIFPVVDAFMAVEARCPWEGLGPSTRFALKLMADLALLDVFVVGSWIACAVTATLPFLSCEVMAGWYILMLATLACWAHKILCNLVGPRASDMITDNNQIGSPAA